jgi:hypothetical protein
MKIKFIIIAFAVSVFSSGTAFGQDDFVPLTSSQLLKGLNDKNYLSSVLNGYDFTLVKSTKIHTTKPGIYEYWQYKSEIFVDAIFTPSRENYIIVRVNKTNTDLSERLILTFPHKRSQEYERHLSAISLSHINKETAYTLRYTKDGINVGVDVWFDDPFYYFQYTTLN